MRASRALVAIGTGVGLRALGEAGRTLGLARPLQARGEHNLRHFDKYVWQVPIPIFDPKEVLHAELVAIAERVEHVAAGVEFAKIRF